MTGGGGGSSGTPLAGAPSDDRPLPYLDHPGPIALAHRGFSLDGLENTMSAFAAAVDHGCRYVETDVHATSDGVLVAFHDDHLDRVTDGTGAIEELPWSTVRTARVGGREPIPTLEELLGAWPELRVNIDVKADAAVEPTIRLLNDRGVHDRVLVGSFDDRRRRAVLDGLGAPVATSAGSTVVRGFVLGHRLPGGGVLRRVVQGIDVLQVPERAGRVRIVTRASIEAAHEAGVGVHVWTVNDPADFHRLLDWGVDGLVTDRVDLLRKVLADRGAW